MCVNIIQSDTLFAFPDLSTNSVDFSCITKLIRFWYLFPMKLCVLFRSWYLSRCRRSIYIAQIDVLFYTEKNMICRLDTPVFITMKWVYIFNKMICLMCYIIQNCEINYLHLNTVIIANTDPYSYFQGCTIFVLKIAWSWIDWIVLMMWFPFSVTFYITTWV